MKKVLILIYIVLIIVFIKFAGTFILNKYYIAKLDDGDIESANFENFLWLNFEEPYVVYYNLGNKHYEENEFADAIKEYEEALEIENIPEKKECSIRINLALARIGTIKSDYDAKENIEDTLDKLKKAKDVLLEEDCAREDGDGHSIEAQKLKEEIDEIEKELKEKMDSEEEENPEEKPEEQEENDPENTQTQEQELVEMLENTSAEREEEMRNMKETYQYYSGKKW